MMHERPAFHRLEPDVILDAVEGAGFAVTGDFMALNSYENRVFEIRLEKPYSEGDEAAGNPVGSRDRLIAKFYRPGRWSREALLEEHAFLEELVQEGLPVAAPLRHLDQTSLGESHGIFFALFPKHKGRLPDELLPRDFRDVGHLLARLHNVGSRRKAHHRPIYEAETVAQALDPIERFIYPDLWPRYRDVAEWILQSYAEAFADKVFQRIHGDCHRGNLLKNLSLGEEGFFLVDFDDFCTGPVAQDFWMLLSGWGPEGEEELATLTAAYRELRKLAPRELEGMEWLRGLRLIHYSGWIARRWQDPSFPRLFPHFESYAYWREDLTALEAVAQRASAAAAFSSQT